MTEREVQTVALCDVMRTQLAALASAVEAHLLGMQRLSRATWSVETAGDKALTLLRDLELALNQARTVGLGLSERRSLFREERGETDVEREEGGGHRDSDRRMRR